ncbi:MAG: hypothetical protein MZV70_67905 [Desulfobacterales bacterium]|nr:hypothetical protein [Desulfobacterales bacterium]
MSIIGLGRLSVYEPRGSYQIILEYVEPAGIGALQVAFEKLKQRLADEGYFDARHKKPLPFLPRKISVITSPSGAVVHDIITVISRAISEAFTFKSFRSRFRARAPRTRSPRRSSWSTRARIRT